MLFSEGLVLVEKERKESETNDDREIGNELKLISHEDHRATMNFFGDRGSVTFYAIAADDITKNEAGEEEAD